MDNLRRSHFLTYATNAIIAQDRPVISELVLLEVACCRECDEAGTCG